MTCEHNKKMKQKFISMDLFFVCIEVLFGGKIFLTGFTFMIFDSFMNDFYVSIKARIPFFQCSQFWSLIPSSDQVVLLHSDRTKQKHLIGLIVYIFIYWQIKVKKLCMCLSRLEVRTNVFYKAAPQC